MLQIELADKDGLKWAQEQVIAHHYLHKPVDVRCSPVSYTVKLFDEKVGCLIFGRPESTKVNGWYGSVEDVATGKCRITRWQVLNLARVWLDPSLQSEGKWYHPKGLIGPSVLPFFYDRRNNWHSTAASYVIDLALERVVFDYLDCKPPVWCEEPYEVRECLSYCDTRIHRGTLYKASNFQLMRTNEHGIETYARSLRRLTAAEHVFIRERSQQDKRAQKLRRERMHQQLSWIEEGA